ncbi:hypothetical protein Ahy_A07g031717 isoform C [Arachis hypogaea]|uniref:MO25-like protein n=1 Tax=Arachis hypogaea TaxID=3818 RepID=A0A445C4W3_ARAHY|nr:hypothetical protein Ahy_A07g031717 isoform C [Arachis hypogaea]
MSRPPLSPPPRLASHELPPSPSSCLLPSLPSSYDLSPPCSCLTSSFRAALVAASSLLVGGLSSSLLVAVSSAANVLSSASQARQDATHVIANLQRQRINSQIIASQYLEKNLDLVDMLINGYEQDGDIALTYGAVARECIRHQCVARHVLGSDHMKKFFDYIQLPNFEIASDALSTFKELLTRHKSTVSEFLSKNYDWFFEEYNTRLLESNSYFTRRLAIKLLADMLLDRSNSATMVRYVSSVSNMVILMNLLRENTIAYWRKFVAEYYSPRAKERRCLSLYNNVGHHALEATFEVLPRLNDIKFGSGVIDELLFLELPREQRFPYVKIFGKQRG